MDLFKRIQDLSDLYDNNGPSAMVPESRPMFNDGGRLGFKDGPKYKKSEIVKGKLENQNLFGVRAVGRTKEDKIPNVKKYGKDYIYFDTEEKAKDFLKNKSKYKKYPLKKDSTLSTDTEKLKKINDYVKDFEKDFGTKPTAKNIRNAFIDKNLGDPQRSIPFYEKKYNVKLPKGTSNKITNVQKDVVKILKDPRIIKKLEEGKFPTITDVSRVIKLDPTLSESRLVDVAEKLRDSPKYKKLADNYLSQPGFENNTKAFGGRKKARSREIFENRFQKLMGLDQKLPNLRRNILKKIQDIIPELKGVLAVDEIAGITSSMRRGSGPYAVFGQILGGDFNSNIKGSGIDKNKSILERQLISLDKNDPKRLELQKRYNNAVTEFEKKANVNNPAKKVKGLKVSFKPPSQTIKNKKIYNQYKDLFDTHYKKHGYSFEVPADRDSLVDISKKLDNKSFQGIVKNRFKNLIGKGGKVGALAGLGTLAGTGFALADESLAADGKSILPEAAAGTTAAATLGTKKGRNIAGRLLGAGFGPTAIAGLTTAGGGYDLTNPLDRFFLSTEAAFAPELVKGTIGATKGMKNRAAQKIAQRVLNLGMSVPTALKVARVAQPLGVMGAVVEGTAKGAKESGKESLRIDQIPDQEQQQMEYDNLITNLRGYAGGGIAKEAGDRSGAMTTSMNPDSQGLRGLLKRAKKI